MPYKHLLSKWWLRISMSDLQQILIRLGFPGGSVVKNWPTNAGFNSWRCGFNSWVGKNPWRRKWQPAPGFLPGEIPWTEEPSGLPSVGSQSQTWLSDWASTHTPIRVLAELGFHQDGILSQSQGVTLPFVVHTWRRVPASLPPFLPLSTLSLSLSLSVSPQI